MVVAADAAAQALGLRAGMTVALAQAATPGLVVVEAEAEADAAALERLAVWTLRYSPIAAADPPDGLVIDVAGAAHLWGGEAALMVDLTERLAKSGVAARTAIADTSCAAWGLARLAPPGTIASPGGSLAALGPLPISALRLAPATVAALRDLGFATVDDLEAAPRRSLALRFGREVPGRLDAAFGRAPDFIEPVLAPSIPHATLRFAEPLGHANGLAIALSRLAATLCAELERDDLGARRLDLRFRRVDNQVAALRVGAARATRDAAHIARLFGERLETIDPGFGIEAAVLAATRVEPLSLRQLEIRPADEDGEPDLGPMIDRIAGRIGEARVYRLAPVESDIPERALQVLPALAPPTGRSWDDGPRPHRLFDPPQSVEVVALLPDQPPAVYTWNGRRHRVVRADAAESVWGEWWRSDAEVYQVRDYFRVEDAEGGRVWLFRASSPETVRWFIQGVFA